MTTPQQEHVTLSSEDIAALYEKYYPILRCKIDRIIHNSEEAEELTQEVFVRILQRPTLTHTTGIATWVNVIALHVALDCLRKRKTRNQYGTTVSLDGNSSEEFSEYMERYWLADSSQDPHELDHDHKTLRVLHALDERYQGWLLLNAQEGYTAREIAAMQGVPEMMVHTGLWRAKKAFRRCYERMAG